jgi:hypothetical protein
MRWQSLAINLDGENVEKRISFQRNLLIMIFVFMLFSSFVMLYTVFDDIWVQFVMGNFINSYLINVSIILFYIHNYIRLSQYYQSM